MVLDVFFFCTATYTNSSFKSHYFLPFLNPHKKVRSTGVKFPRKDYIPHARVIMDKFDRLHIPLLSSLTIPASQPNKNRKPAPACYQNSRFSLLFLAGIPSITTENSQILHPTNCFHMTSQKFKLKNYRSHCSLACSRRSDSGEPLAFIFSRSFLLRTAPHYLNAWNRLIPLRFYCHWVKKKTYFRKFCHLNSSCIRKRISLMFMSLSKNKFTLLQQNSVTDVSVPADFRPPCWS